MKRLTKRWPRAAGVITLAASLLSSGCRTESPSAPDAAAVPEITHFGLSRTQDVAPGDTIVVTYAVHDERGIRYTELFVGGNASTSLLYDEDGVRTASRTRRIRVPSGVHLDRPLEISIEARNVVNGLARSGPLSLTLRDAIPPRVWGDALASSGGVIQDVTLAVGEPLRLRVFATDNHRLAWIGYRLGSPASAQDSTSVADSAAILTLTVPTLPRWSGSSSLTLFARDVAGNLAEFVPAAERVSVYPVVSRPVRVLPLTAEVWDVVLDPRRNVLYLSQPDSSRIAVLDLVAFAFQPPIRLPGRPGGIDLSVGGDSLLVALPGRRAVAVVNVATANGEPAVVPLAIDSSHGRRPYALRVAGNDKLLLSLLVDGPASGYRFLEMDLRDGTQRIRPDAGYVSMATGGTPLARSFDRSRIIAANAGECCAADLQVYNAPHDAFSIRRGSSGGTGTPLSSDSLGSSFLSGNIHLSADLLDRRILRPPRYANYYWVPSALSLDGTRAYFGTDYGLVVLQVSDGSVIEGLNLPGDDRLGERPARLLVLPNGAGLFGWGRTRALLIETGQ